MRKHNKKILPKKRGDFFDKIEMPTDVLRGEVIVSIWENRRMQIQNVKGIIECSAEKVRLLTKWNRIEVIGKSLDVNEYSKDEVVIKGLIEQIIYLEKI